MRACAHRQRLVPLIHHDRVSDLVERGLQLVLPDGEWLIIKVEAVVEGAVELASGVVWGVGVETDWISDEVETLAQPLSANLELGAGVSQPGFDTNFLNLDGVAAFQDLGAGQETSLPYLVNPEPPQGRITLTLAFRGLLRYQHSFQEEDGQAHGLGEPGVWHLESIGDQAAMEMEVQIARSDWYEQVVEKLAIGSYLITPLYLPYGVKSWQATLGHMNDALRALVQGNPPGVFAACRAAIDALPGDKTNIFAAMPAGKRRDAINELTKSVGKYIHSGRHVVPDNGEEQAGDFPVYQQDAVFAYNLTKLVLSHAARLTLTN